MTTAVELGAALLELNPEDLTDVLANCSVGERAAIDVALADPAVAWMARCRMWHCAIDGCDGLPHPGWPFKHGRWAQMPPPEADGTWLIWFYMAGRGAGKTRSGAEATSDWCRENPGRKFALVGETLGDVRRTMCEGVSGLRSVLPVESLRGGTWETAFNRGEVTVYLANGCELQGFSSETPDRLRGPEHGGAWVDEPAKLKDAHKGISTDPNESVTWNNLMFGLRAGDRPVVFVTGTPKRVKLVRDIIGRPSTRLVRGSTYDNIANLARQFITEVIDPYRGTRLERQEIGGELIDEVEGALVSTAKIEATRVTAAPDLTTLAIGVDPPGGRTECGIVAVGRDKIRHGYVVADASGRYGADEWPVIVVMLYHELDADFVVGEKNYGGDMVETLVQQAARSLFDRGEIPSPHVPYKDANATRGKAVRAQPVGLLFDQRRFHVVGSFPELEDEMTTWTEDDKESPNRLDACVWAAHAAVLRGGGRSRSGVGDLTGSGANITPGR